MDRLIVARHGDNMGIHLSDIGRQNMIKLGNKIKDSIKKSVRILILTSTADASRESAEILSGILCSTPEQHEMLWFNHEKDSALPKILGLVRSKKDNADIIILVTHREYSREFPSYFGKNEFKVSHFPIKDIGWGQAWDIGCEQKTIHYVS